MATVVRRNNRLQDEIRRGLGISSGNSGGTTRIASTGTVRPTSGSGAAPAGWYGSNPTPSAAQIQGRPSEAIGFSGPSQNVTQGINSNVTVGQAPGAVSGSSSGSTTSSGFQRRNAPAYEDFDYEDWDAPTFRTSNLTNDYLRKMQETENARPDPFQSRYEGAIQNILDGILSNGQKPFDINTDANYQTLYNQYAQQYAQQANRGMRDTMGAMQAATGGYGSTAATAAAGQAYDRAMEGLNSNNIALMQLAYQMNQADRADRYNQLGAVTGLDNTDYARYRDNVGDWQTDRNYFANQYQNMYGNDWQKYAFDTQLDWDKYQFQTGLDWQNHQAAQNRAWDDYTFGTNMDWNQYADAQNRAWQEKEFEYQQGRDAKSDYDAAFNRALSLAQSGMGIPATYGNQLEPETLQQLNALAAQVQAKKALAAGGSGGSGGGGGRRRKSGGSSSGSGSAITKDQFNQDVIETKLAYPGMSTAQIEQDLKKIYSEGGVDIVNGKYTEGGQASIGALKQAQYSVDTNKAAKQRQDAAIKVSQDKKKKK